MGKYNRGYDKIRIVKKLLIGRNAKTVTGLFILLLALLALSPVSNAGTITVGHTTGADYRNIQDAINASGDSDTIQVWYGEYDEHIVINKPLILESRDGTSSTFIDGPGTGIVVAITSDNVTFNGFTVQNGEIGIELTGNSGVITDNVIRTLEGVAGRNSSSTDSEIGGYSCGIYLNSGTSNRISRNTISSVTGGTGGNNTYSGLWAGGGHGGTGGYGTGIYLKSGKDNTITGNTISSIAGGTGGRATGWYRDILTPGTPLGHGGTGGTGYGICIDSSEDNTIFDNTVSGVYKGTGGYGNASYGSAGLGYGIAAISATNRNEIYHNNFKHSDTQDGFDSGGNNAWDGGSIIIGGNYWSDYSEHDTDGDGIGNTPYVLAGTKGAKDYLPFMHENGWDTQNIFDTGSGTYPSIRGIHNGTITPSQDITINNMYTYPCTGTGGHSEYVEFSNESGIIATGHWNGYNEDWHDITISPSFVMLAGLTYNYSIRTSSYPQIIHASEFGAKGGKGKITCTEFIDANGNTYTDWIPAIRLE